MALIKSAFLMLKEMIFPNSNSPKLENLLRTVLFLIFTPIVIFFTLSLMLIVGSAVALVQLLVLMVENSLSTNISLARGLIKRWCKKLFFRTVRDIKVADKTLVSSDSGIGEPSEASEEEFAEPHDAWVKELGTGAYDPNFEEKKETLYLVFWYYVCNNFLM